MSPDPVPDDVQHLAAYDFEGRNEDEIRGDWIEPLLRLLGYGLGTDNRIQRGTSLALQPPTRMLGSRRIAVDFIPTVRGHRLWIIEAKRPQESLFDNEHLGQAWSYATDPRVHVPLIVLCDGTRIGIFDVTKVEWDEPVFDRLKEELPQHFGELFQLLGAPNVAESVRRRQLVHLRDALEAQVDLGALDRTGEDIAAMLSEVRPMVVQRRKEIREQVRIRAVQQGQKALDAAGMWGLAQHVNGPFFYRQSELDQAVGLVRDQSPDLRTQEFDLMMAATTPAGERHSRMWFPMRVLRMAAAITLSEDEGCGAHCREIARQAAHQHSTAFGDDPLLAEVYRLQRLLGPLGWRLAANAKNAIDAQAQVLVDTLDAEAWLKLDAQVGVSAQDLYVRTARLSPRMILAGVHPWNTETISATADGVQLLLESLLKPAGLAALQPAGDPWMNSWLTGDPVRSLSAWVLEDLAGRMVSGPIADLIAELRAAN